MKKYKIISLIILALSIICYGQGSMTQKQFIVVDEAGDPMTWTTLTSITIYDAGTTDEATIYSDMRGNTSKTNPIVTGLDEVITFWSRDADYKVTVTDGTYTRTLDNLNASDTVIIFPTYLPAMSSRTASDSQSFTFGSDGDWVAAAQDSTMDWTPAVANSAFAIGNASYYSDLYLYGSTEDYNIYWDASENTLEILDDVTFAIGTGDDFTIIHNGSNTTISGNFIVAGEPTFQTDVLFDGTYDISYDDNRYQLLFEDSAILGIGGDHDAAGDVVMYHDGSDFYMDAAVADEGWNIGDTSTGFDITYYFEGAGQFRSDYDGDFFNLTDDMDLRFGTGASSDGDFQISSDSSNVLAIEQVDSGVGTITIGADNKGIDVTFYAETASDYMMWDQDGNTQGSLIFEDSHIHMMDDTTIIFGDDSDSTMQYDEDGLNALQITGPMYGYELVTENVTANDTLTTAEFGKYFIVDGNTVDLTLTLPSVAAGEDGGWYVICDVNEASASDVSIAPADSDTINGSSNDFSSAGTDKLPCNVMLVYNHSNTDWVAVPMELGNGTAAWDSE